MYMVTCSSRFYSLNRAIYNLTFLSKDEFIIIILLPTPHLSEGGGSRTHQANPGQDACTLSPPYVVTLFARGTHKMLYDANLV
jgi:hypothetical protein